MARARQQRSWAGGHTRPLDLRAGDPVVITAGSDRGKRGVVVRALPEQQRVVVGGVNIHKRHQRAGQRRGGTTAMQGGVVDFPAPIHYSNVQLVCPHCDRPTRVRKALFDGQFGIACRHCGERYERVTG
ncbi:MAG TPA: 50S ribosomal protein L24 [Verrucomicrobiae bacterium]|nr:50S ribosomal protein L24 [Verrucomicrobiae bacterium]